MMSSLRFRLTLSHLVVIVLAMSLSGFLLLSFLENYFRQAMEESLVAQARITAQALIPGAITGGPPVETQSPAYNTVQQQQLSNLSLQAENAAPPAGKLTLDLTYLANASFQLSTQLDTRIRILDPQGTVLVDSQPGEQNQTLKSDSLVRTALAGQYASRIDQADQNLKPVMHVALPVQMENRLVGVVYLSQSLDDVTTVLYDLRTRWLLSTAIALLLSATVGLFLSRALTTPLRRLTAAAEAVAEGQLNQQVPVDSRDELGHLSQTFNQMTARLQAARQAQINMVANVSHELRTPLTTLKGLVETLRAGAVADLEVRDSFLETMEDETDRLIRLVNDLLLLSRADSDALDLRPEPVDLKATIQATIDRLAVQAADRRIDINLDINGDNQPVRVDPDRIEQVLLNLIDNALKYSQPGGKVTIRVQEGHDEMSQVQVQDHGIGIPAQALAHLGQRFYRVDMARARAKGGSGLGLAIALALVEAHGGRLWIDSQEGQGTLVTFTLPH